MPDVDRYALAARFALGHKVLNSKFKKLWRSLDDSEKDMIAKRRRLFPVGEFYRGTTAAAAFGAEAIGR
jgi:hypothetical protein